MTLLDDDIDDLLHGFRADEAELDDATRTRMWARIVETVPDAADELDALDPTPGIRRLPRRSSRPRHRILVAAAAVLVLLAVAGVVLRSSGPGGDPVTAGPTTTAPLPRDLQELADAVAGREVVVLGQSADVRYTHLVVHTRFRSIPTVAETVTAEENWVDRTGSGVWRDRETGDERRYDPGERALGVISPADLLTMADDPAAVAAAVIAGGAEDAGPGVSQSVAETLAYPGIPGPARAALLRFLDGLGFVPVTAGDLGPTVMRVEGPGQSGSTLQVDIDLQSGQVVASSLATRQGGSDVRAYADADLRADTRSR